MTLTSCTLTSMGLACQDVVGPREVITADGTVVRIRVIFARERTEERVHESELAIGGAIDRSRSGSPISLSRHPCAASSP